MIKRIKNTVLVLSAFLMLFGAFSPSLSLVALAYDIDIQEAIEEERELTEEEFDAFIAMMEEYISFEDGEIIIEDGLEGLSNVLGDEVVEVMTGGIEYLNELADEDELIITENGTIFEADDDDFILQSGGRNRITWHWWGGRAYTCTSNTNRNARTFQGIGNTAAGVAAVSGFFGGGFVAVLSSLGGLWFRTLGTNMSNRNSGHSRGIRVSMTWVAAYRTARQ